MYLYMGVSKNREFSPKMDGENHGKPHFLMDDLGGKPTIYGNTHMAHAKPTHFLDKKLSPCQRRFIEGPETPCQRSTAWVKL